MSDRELLELAAKAAGIELYWPDEETFDVGWALPAGPLLPGRQREKREWKDWNPRTSNGDALALAATLRLQIKPGKHKGDGCTVESQRAGIAGCTAFRDDPAQQMREAIVQVAAEIGKAML